MNTASKRINLTHPVWANYCTNSLSTKLGFSEHKSIRLYIFISEDFWRKSSIFDRNFYIWKCQFLTKISIFDEKVRFWIKISIFDVNLNFGQKCRFLSKISTLDQNFDFWRKSSVLHQHVYFRQKFLCLTTISILTKISIFKENFDRGRNLYFDPSFDFNQYFPIIKNRICKVSTEHPGRRKRKRWSNSTKFANG